MVKPPFRYDWITMLKTLVPLLPVLALAACAVTDRREAEATSYHLSSLEAECGPEPVPAPGFSVEPGTYPGQGAHVCMPTADYVNRDRWVADVYEYANCAARFACTSRGGEASPSGCTVR